MSQVADLSRVALLLADYAAADSANKVNALGLGWAVVGLNPQTGMSPPQTVIAMVHSPPATYGEEFSVTLTLHDDAGTPVQVPGPSGQLQAMRLTNPARVEEPFQPGTNIPRGLLWAHTQILLNLPTGLALEPGHLYTWKLDIDSTHDEKWAVSFYVPSARQGPVFGGPANPANIPGVASS